MITSNTVSSIKVMPPRFNKLSINEIPEEIYFPLYSTFILSTKGIPWNQTDHNAPSKLPNNITGTDGIFKDNRIITTIKGTAIHPEILNISYNSTIAYSAC